MRVKIDYAQAERFLSAMAPGEPITFQTFDDQKEKGRHFLAQKLHGTLTQHFKTLCDLNHLGAGIFWMPNRGDGKGRSAKNVIAVRYVFVDLDGAPLGPMLAAEPDAVVISSPGRFHGYWRMEECPLGEFRDLQDGLAAKFNGDCINDLCRVMRVPGFVHQKDGDAPFMTRIMRL